MSAETLARKAELKQRLIEIAENRIATGGIAALKARDLAAAAGCSVGAIYNVFDDLNALVMAVNARTFHALGLAVSAAVAKAEPAGPQDQMIVMSEAYLDFAAQNTRLWRALFDLELTADGPAPEWYIEELGKLLALISEPLVKIYPDKSRKELDLMVWALFSAVHGIVLLGLQSRISPMPRSQIETMIGMVLREIG
jgi:AcrR family transcriptional regulator